MQTVNDANTITLSKSEYIVEQHESVMSGAPGFHR